MPNNNKSNINQQLDNIEDDLIKLETGFQKYREHWDKQVKHLFPMLKKMNQLTDAQTLFLSYRHQISDTKFKNLTLINKKNDLKKECEKALFKVYEDMGVTKRKEKIKQDLRKLIRFIELLDIWVSYCDNLVDTLDKMSYAFKYRIDVENLK